MIRYQYVIDPIAQHLVEKGVDPDQIEDAYTLAMNPEKRIRFQADLQEYVDHAVASTVNLPEPVTDPDDIQEFGDMLMQYLPRLRGITCYPDGARSGQPLTSVAYSYAKDQTGVTFEENREAQCLSGICGA